MRVLGIIPARGGSKGVSRKNIKALCGQPLLGYTAVSSLAAKSLSRVIVSTEDEEIAEVALSLGLEVPFIRPAELAEDQTPTIPVVIHAIRQLELTGDAYDAVCLLQPTNPLRRSQDIDACVDLLKSSDADSVVSVLPVPDTYNPMWTYWRDADGKISLSSGEIEPPPRRQDLPCSFHRDGTIYVTRLRSLFDHGNLYGRKIHGFVINPSYSINIDTKADWEKAERLIGELSITGNCE